MDDQLLYEIKQKGMKQEDIELAFQKVNPKLLEELEPNEKEEAVQEFKMLYQDQMVRVESKLKRRQKVQLNLEEQAQIQKQMITEIETDMKQKMEGHIRKRKSMQLQRIKNYHNLEKVWKDKMQQIANQNKHKQFQSIKKANAIQKQAQNFWKNKTQSLQEEQTESRANKRYQSAKLHGEKFNFITGLQQVHQFMPIEKNELKEKKEKEHQQFFPLIDREKRLKTWDRGSKSMNKEKDKNQVIKQHLIKSNEQWKEKEDLYFQKAMEKLDKILQKRMKIKLKINKEIKTAKNNRLLRERSVLKVEKYQSVDRSSNTMGNSSAHSNSNKKLRCENNINMVRKSASTHLRHEQLQKSRFDERTHLFYLQKKRMRRDNFHLMVKQAVNLVKLQALRNKK